MNKQEFQTNEFQNKNCEMTEADGCRALTQVSSATIDHLSMAYKVAYLM